MHNTRTFTFNFLHRFTMMLMQFGQFLDHDISFTPEFNLDSGKLNCCNTAGLSPECFPIEIPLPDPAFTESCHEFVRSTPHCSSPSVRQQLNAITAYVDGSMIYGSDADTAANLRTNSFGLMKTDNNGQSTLPRSDPCPAAYGASALGKQFLGGDRRVNENPGLQSLHTLFVREHNRYKREHLYFSIILFVLL